MKRIGFIVAAIACSLYSFAQPTEKSVLGKAKANMKITAALQEIDVSNYKGAVIILSGVLDEFHGDVDASFLMAQCLFELHNFKDARAYLDSAVNYATAMTPAQWLVAGKIYQSVAQLDKAEEAFMKFKATKDISKDDLAEVNQYIRECEYARKEMANGKSVSIKSLGGNVNSVFEDYAPVLSPDGNTLYFTSRRPVDSDENKIDKKGDYKFFEDIYESKLVDGKWQQATLVEGALNTGKYDAVLNLSPDGKEMYVYVNDGSSGGDIFSSVYENGSWSAVKPTEIPINSSNFEGSIAVTPDGNTVFFMSERPGGYGQGDIWKIEKNSIGEWDKPVNLGPAINTPFDEKFVWVHPDGTTLFFASNGHFGLGSYDIYRTTLTDGRYTPPVNLGYPINTTVEESTFSFSADKKTMYLAALRNEGMGERDIYQIDVTNSGLFAVPDVAPGSCLLTGVVLSEKADKVAWATITVVESLTNKELGTTESDAQGTYQIKIANASGDCVIRTYAKGFLSSSERLGLKGTSGKVVVRDLTVRTEVAAAPAAVDEKPAKEPAKPKRKKKSDDEEEEEEETESDD